MLPQNSLNLAPIALGTALGLIVSLGKINYDTHTKLSLL
jgi:hypothetical protein